MRLNGTVVQDVADGKSARGERARHQQTAMTFERLALGAHQADAALRRIGDEPIEAGAKIRLPRHRLIVGDAVAIERRIARPAAELIARRQ